MGGHVPLAVVILKDFILYPSSKAKELSNGTQQVPLGTFTQFATFTKFGSNSGHFGAIKVNHHTL